MAGKDGHTRLWVANLQEDLSKEQIIHLFEKYGAVHNIVRKGNFASIEFENGSEALKAKRGLDQVDYHGRRLNIDWYRGDKFGKLEGKNWWGGQCGHPRYKHRVCVLGLPKGIGYQDVLNLAWEAGFSVVFIDIQTSRCGFIYGIIEYAHYDDYKYALEYLDGKQYSLNNIQTSNESNTEQNNNTNKVYTLRFIKGDELMEVERYVSHHNPPPTMIKQDEQKTGTNTATITQTNTTSYPHHPHHGPTQQAPMQNTHNPMGYPPNYRAPPQQQPPTSYQGPHPPSSYAPPPSTYPPPPSYYAPPPNNTSRMPPNYGPPSNYRPPPTQ